LSGLLRSLTGLNTQQHIHLKLIEKAKALLSTTPLTVSEIAYALGRFYRSVNFSRLKPMYHRWNSGGRLISRAVGFTAERLT